MVALGAGVGFVGGFINPFTVGVAHSIAGLPIYSGMGFRVAVYIVLYVATVLYIMRYARKVKENPFSSVVFDLKVKQKSMSNISTDNQEIPDLTFRQKGVLLVMLIGFITLTYGVLKHG